MSSQLLKIFVENFRVGNEFYVVYIPIVANKPVGPGKVGKINLSPGFTYQCVIGVSVLEILKKIRKSMVICTNDGNLAQSILGESKDERANYIGLQINELVQEWGIHFDIEKRGNRYTDEIVKLIESQKVVK